MKHALLLAAMSLACGSTVLASQPACAAHARTAVVVLDETYPASDPRAAGILRWISTRSPQYAPLETSTAKIRLERTFVATGGRAAQVAAANGDAPLPPTGLPDTGQPGEILKVESILPDGSTQSWEYRWEAPASGHGGGWVFVAYSVRIGQDPVEIE